MDEWTKEFYRVITYCESTTRPNTVITLERGFNEDGFANYHVRTRICTKTVTYDEPYKTEIQGRKHFELKAETENANC